MSSMFQELLVRMSPSMHPADPVTEAGKSSAENSSTGMYLSPSKESTPKYSIIASDYLNALVADHSSTEKLSLIQEPLSIMDLLNKPADF